MHRQAGHDSVKTNTNTQQPNVESTACIGHMNVLSSPKPVPMHIGKPTTFPPPNQCSCLCCLYFIFEITKPKRKPNCKHAARNLCDEHRKTLEQPPEYHWNTIQNQMETHWKTFGRPLEYPWKTFGRPLEDPRKTFRRRLEDRRKTFGRPLGDLKNTFGRPLEDPWNTIGRPLEDLWKTLGRPLEDL